MGNKSSQVEKKVLVNNSEEEITNGSNCERASLCKDSTEYTPKENGRPEDKSTQQSVHSDSLGNGSVNDIPAEPMVQVVAAIDFGTTFMGYAFSFYYAPLTCFTSTHGGKLTNDKIPTTILYEPNEDTPGEYLLSFGHDAEDKYASFGEEQQNKCKYYRRFKMALYTSLNLKRETTIVDSEGRPAPAMPIFCDAIKYLYTLVLETICESGDVIHEKDIKWMITIPAIWTDSARQFMREAAINAGIPQDRLHLVLEPEAASLFCKEKSVFKGAMQKHTFSVGKKYILADLGGGTADVCVHEIIDVGNIREIYRASGEAVGGTHVDMEFQQFLIKLVGADIISCFRQKRRNDYNDLMRDFEIKKTTFSKSTKHVTLRIPVGLLDMVYEKLGMDLESIISGTVYSKSVRIKSKKLDIEREIMESFFKPSIEEIIQLVKDVIHGVNDPAIDTLILVGGYSESQHVRETIRANFEGFNVLLEPDARLAVLKGAVLMGHKPWSIVERRVRFTYGFSLGKPFIEGEHPDSLKVSRDGVYYCRKLFHKQIEKGEIITFGKVFKYDGRFRMTSAESKRFDIQTELYRSTEKDPKYCTEEENCVVAGHIVMKPPRLGWPDLVEVELHIIVGETEFIVKAFDKTTKKEYEANINFL